MPPCATKMGCPFSAITKHSFDERPSSSVAKGFRLRERFADAYRERTEKWAVGPTKVDDVDGTTMRLVRNNKINEFFTASQGGSKDSASEMRKYSRNTRRA